MEHRPELYRKYEAYIFGYETNISVQFHFEDWLCFPVIVEVSKLYSALNVTFFIQFYIFLQLLA